ncbi:methyl-accepting chemotaxis protein, partial [Magnetospirillum sp. UT-4]|uniref:methyl-accepting chemotaxis protein n=1 Tax=Magnetospirillum sp. UT-4 TaxID=2681467 RepID=UPI0015745937
MSAKTSGLTVKGRIWGGFIAVLVLLAVVAVLAFLGFNNTGDSVARMGRTANLTSVVQQVERDVVGLRRNVVLYEANGSPQQVARIRALETSLRKDMQDFIARTAFPDQKAKVETMLGMFEAYMANFNKVVPLREEREKLVREGTDVLGRDTSAMFAALNEAKTKERDFDTLVVVSASQDRFVQARLAVLRFQGREEQKDADTANKLINDAMAALETAAQAETHPADKAELLKLVGAIRTYRDTFARQVEVFKALHNLVGVENARIAGEFGDLASKTREIQLAKMAEVRDATDSFVDTQGMISLTVSAVAMVIGLLAAFVIARSIL